MSTLGLTTALLSFVLLTQDVDVGAKARLGIDAPEKIVEYKIVKCKARNADKDAALNWDVASIITNDDGQPDLADIEVEVVNGELWFTGPPGKYVVKLWANKGTLSTQARKTVNITESKRKPKPPTPPVPPGPVPDDTKSDSLYVVVIKDVLAISPNQARVLGDTPFWDSLKPKHEWDFFDKTSPLAIQNRYVAAVDGVALPALLLMDKMTGAVRYRGTLPNTTAEVKSFVDKFTK